MNILSSGLIVLGLCLFETISSIDNAIINAEVLSDGREGQALVSLLGILFAVFVVRGILPSLIVWHHPQLGPWGL